MLALAVAVAVGIMVAVVLITYSATILGVMWWLLRVAFVIALFGGLGLLTQGIGP